MDTLGFRLTCLWFGLRDLLSPPERVLGEVDIRPGFRVLDYGCGPGSYALAAARLVGPPGQVYAADVNPLALRRVQSVAAKKTLENIETIHTDCATGLADNSVDVVLLYDTYHDLENPDGVLGELHRVLKPGSVLSFSDHHLSEDEILTELTGDGLFRLSDRGRKMYTFLKKDQTPPKRKGIEGDTADPQEEPTDLAAELQMEVSEQERALYSAKLVEEARYPSHIGRLRAPDAYGRVNGWCGDMMEFYLQLDGERIEAVKFVTDGCGPAIACGNALARLVEGLTLEEAVAVQPEKIVAALDGLPKGHAHCAELAVTTLQNAIFNWRTANKSGRAR